MMKTIGLVLFAGALAAFMLHSSSITNSQDEVETEFISFIGKWKKSYASSEEYVLRKENFAKTLAHVKEQNSKPDKMWTAGINQFSDLTTEEMSQYMGHIPSEEKFENSPIP